MMKTPFKYIYLICCLLLSFNLSAQTIFKEQQAGHVFYLNVPDYMSRTVDLNAAATLQYSNEIRDAYIIVIEDAKEDLQIAKLKFENAVSFLEYFSNDYMKDATSRKLTPVTSALSANGYKMAQRELYYTSDGTPIWMLITVIETKDYFYKILSWSTQANRSRQIDDFKFAAASLREAL